MGVSPVQQDFFFCLLKLTHFKMRSLSKIKWHSGKTKVSKRRVPRHDCYSVGRTTKMKCHIKGQPWPSLIYLAALSSFASPVPALPIVMPLSQAAWLCSEQRQEKQTPVRKRRRNYLFQGTSLSLLDSRYFFKLKGITRVEKVEVTRALAQLQSSPLSNWSCLSSWEITPRNHQLSPQATGVLPLRWDLAAGCRQSKNEHCL